MKRLKMENIKFEFQHVSIKNPLIKIVIDGKIYANMQIDNNDPITIECNLENGKHSIEIQHYGKNYNYDSDRSFELKKIKINDVDVKYEMFKFVQYPDLPPWESWHSQNNPIAWINNLHLGHNGKLVYNNFQTPSIDWFKKNFDNVHQPVGMQSSKEILNLAKEFFIKESDSKK